MKTEPKISRVSTGAIIEQAESKVQPRPMMNRGMWWIGAALALLYFMTARPMAGSDPASQSAFSLAAALATEHSPMIDHYAASSLGGFLASSTDAPNLAYFAGHYYADSAPGSAMLAVPFYLLGQYFGPDGPSNFGLGLVALAGAATALLVYGVARRLGTSEASARYAAVSLGVSSALWREAGRFGPGVFSLLLLAVSLWLALPPLPANTELEGGAKLKTGWAVWLGLALGFGVVVDYPNFIWTALLVGYLLLGGRIANWKGWAGLGLGWVVGLLPLALYNWWALGKPWAFSYGFLLNNPEARSLSGQFLSFNLGQIRDIIFGPGRGLLGPFVLFFGGWGLVALYGQRGKRRETVLFLSLIGAIFLAGLLRRPVGVGTLPADFAAGLLVPVALGMAVWHERFLFLTRIEQPWLPGLATAGAALYYWLAGPGLFANFGAFLYLLPLVLVVGVVWLLWRYTPPYRVGPKALAALVAFILLGLGLAAMVGPVRPAFAESGSNNLIYNGQLGCENGTRAGWYLQGAPLSCGAGPLKIAPGQKLQPYLIPVQGGKLYQLQFEAQGSGQLEWLWSAEPAIIDRLKFTNNFSQSWQSGAFKDSRAAPPGVAYLQLVFTPASEASLSNFRLDDDSVRVEPMKNYAKAALSFSFDWESAMGGLIHSKGGAPGASEGDRSGTGLSDSNLQAAVDDAVQRGLDMRKGADYLLELFTRFGVRGTFYANGYNLLDGNREKQTFVNNPVYKWAVPKNGWNSDYWLTHPWYGFDPYGDVKSDPAWYFGDQTDRLNKAGQDIESHTFGHVYVRGTTPQEFLQDTEAILRYAQQRKLPPLRHFAFPWKSSNSLTAEWYKILADRGFESVTRLYDGDQGILQGALGQLSFDNGKRAAGNKVAYENFAGPSNPYYYLGQVKDEPRLLVLHDYQLVPFEQSEPAAKGLVDELLRRRGYGSIWTHPEAIVTPSDQSQWSRVVQYAAEKRDSGLWVDSVANIIQHRRDIEKVAVSTTWSDGGKKARVTVTNRANHEVSGLTLTLPASIKSANGASEFKGSQLIVPTLQSGQSATIDVEF